MSKHIMSLTVNGDLHELMVDNTDTLLDAIRNQVGLTGSSYWFNNSMLAEISSIHDYLHSLPESGKVLSIDSSLQLLRSLDARMVTDDSFLYTLYNGLPEDIK